MKIPLSDALLQMWLKIDGLIGLVRYGYLFFVPHTAWTQILTNDIYVLVSGLKTRLSKLIIIYFFSLKTVVNILSCSRFFIRERGDKEWHAQYRFLIW